MFVFNIVIVNIIAYVQYNNDYNDYMYMVFQCLILRY